MLGSEAGSRRRPARYGKRRENEKSESPRGYADSTHPRIRDFQSSVCLRCVSGLGWTLRGVRVGGRGGRVEVRGGQERSARVEDGKPRRARRAKRPSSTKRIRSHGPRDGRMDGTDARERT